MATEIYAGRVSDFTDGRRALVQVDGHDVFVLRHDGRFFAYENVCPHMGGPVGEGVVIGKVEALLDADRAQHGEQFSTDEFHLVCPWHGYEYEIETGRCAANPRLHLWKFETVEREGEVYVIA